MTPMRILKRYAAALCAAALFAAFIIAFPGHAGKAASSLLGQVSTMLLVVPPIFILIGLLDVWVPRETIMKHMGNASGIKGALLAFCLGTLGAGPLYGAFPVSAVLMKKGAGFTNILIFIGSWSTTKIPMLLFEANSLGVRFSLSRLAINIPGILIMAFALKAIIPAGDVERMYAEAEKAG